MAAAPIDLLQGTLDVLVLKTLSWGPRHGYAVARGLQQLTDDVLQIEEGGDEARGAREGRMAGDVAHPIVTHPDPAVVLQTPEKVFTRARGHVYP